MQFTKLVIIFLVFLVTCCAFGQDNSETYTAPIYDIDGKLIAEIDPFGQLIGLVEDENGELLAQVEVESLGTSDTAFLFTAEAQISANPNTIDQINLSSGGTRSYSTTDGMYIVKDISKYMISDGTSWSSGAGSAGYGNMKFDFVEKQGAQLFYHFTSSDLLVRRTDYNASKHSANFVFNVAEPMVLIATEGSTSGVLDGKALIVRDSPVDYIDSRYNYLTAFQGSVVSFHLDYTLSNSATFTESLFEDSFKYVTHGYIDLTDVISSPELIGLTLTGPPLVPEDSEVSFHALATFETDYQREISQDAVWSTSNVSLAKFVEPGQLLINPVDEDTKIDVYVTYSDQGIEMSREKTITILNKTNVVSNSEWPMYQANARHDGYLPVTLHSDLLQQLWQTKISSDASYALNRITAAAGRVYTSGKVRRIDVVDGQTGVVLWTNLLGTYFNGSFPSYANGMVYLQTCHNSGDTWLNAYDVKTGEQVFKSAHAAQWENYYAPTIYDGKVYINGGRYGGAYGFDGYTGKQDWFIKLPQVDDWTPAVDCNYVYAFVGGYLHVIDRVTGDLDFKISCSSVGSEYDRGTLIPVIGGDNNIMVIHNNRLINFDVVGKSIAYVVDEDFSGQVSVAKGQVFAINDGNIDIREEATGDLLHKIDISDDFVDAMIITDSHIIARSSSTTYLISLETHEVEWQARVSGFMALSDDRLYIGDEQNVLTAILAPALNSSDLVGLEITGPEEVYEYDEINFSPVVEYSGGYKVEVVQNVQWSIEPNLPSLVELIGAGRIKTFDQSGTVTLKAKYTQNDQTVEASKTIQIVHPVTTYYVNAETGDDENFGLAPESAFKTIQRAIDESWDEDTVEVYQGVYEEAITFLGKKIMVKGVEAPPVLFGGTLAPISTGGDATVDSMKSTTLNSVTFDGGETCDSILQNFIISGSFTALFCGDGSPTLRNLTVVRNGYGLSVWGDGEPMVENCIFWYNSIADMYGGTANYSCIERGSVGIGNISQEPYFVDAEACDFHLLSGRGRFHTGIKQWVLDDLTSPCIDAGNPDDNPQMEKMPNGGRINMGAYGGMYYASMSEWSHQADVNKDGCVNMTDFSIFAESWLWSADWYEVLE